MKRFEISQEQMERILNVSELPERKLCTTIRSLFCPSDIDCSNELYHITNEQIGNKSLNGVIYTAACMESPEQKCNYVAKWTPARNKIQTIRETDIQIIASKVGIAPKVKQLLVCGGGVNDRVNGGSLLIMERMRPFSLGDVLKSSIGDPLVDPEARTIIKNRIDYVKEAILCIEKFHELGYAHKDTHLNNFMFDTDDNVKMIDFGSAYFIEGMNYWRDFNILHEHIISLANAGNKLSYVEKYVSKYIEDKKQRENEQILEKVEEERNK